MPRTIRPQCYVEPKQELFTGEETSLDVLLRGKLGHDIQGKILQFLEHEPDFPDEEEHIQFSYIEFYDDLMNKDALPVYAEEAHCFQEPGFYDDDFVICQEFWLKDADNAFMEGIYKYNNHTF